ncbi:MULTISPECIES: LysR family transcriptional regulator [unclassified Thermoactinomyces]|jgi:LysR family transcriptional regulator, salicylic acid-responsive activator of bsdBCD|uniref:LysR family transcriptional regulator n=1 Tax=unclassified Thermoactinomyces TaxID=2634588 RepID=UPI0018DE4130|nr:MULTISPECIES: LysR family transcriptional regulator [unclassified Thermoactinomyces]MBH8596770.1 LysR family transcriptional regulator [Thermoactinomyces sp. CICC 10523]MBH8603531.1 LysR family transcriptional regulator [Thermoactinomyces sp. CICC 10522]MBH8606695.1 LysR family transcriptional regulator [Thermoactinomyces sp. CICC 10521]
MDIRQLKYFVAIAEEKTITGAARRLHMAQPPLSRQLKRMEEELGVTLFERNKKKCLTLTHEGELFLKRAKETLNHLETAIVEVRELRERVSGTLAVGSTIYCASLMLEKVMLLRKRNPALTFNIWEGESPRLLELLESRQIEIAIATSSVSGRNIEKRVLPADPCVLVLPEKWTVPYDTYTELANISDLPLILLRPLHGKGLYDQIINEFQRLEREPNILCECHDSAMLLSLVSAGFGATILPLSMLSLNPFGNFKILRFKNDPLVMEPAVIWRANSYLSRSAKEFLHLF